LNDDELFMGLSVFTAEKFLLIGHDANLADTELRFYTRPEIGLQPVEPGSQAAASSNSVLGQGHLS
jgi:hypothetical protein